MVTDKCPNGPIVLLVLILKVLKVLKVLRVLSLSGPPPVTPPHPTLPRYHVTPLLGVWVFTRNIQQKVVKILDNAY